MSSISMQVACRRQWCYCVGMKTSTAENPSDASSHICLYCGRLVESFKHAEEEGEIKYICNGHRGIRRWFGNL